MSEKQETIYCGSGKVIHTKIGEMTKLSFSKKDINEMVKYMKENSLEWLNCNFSEKKTKVDGKPTHYISIDTWKPESKKINDGYVKTEPTKTEPTKTEPESDDSSDLPF